MFRAVPLWAFLVFATAVTVGYAPGLVDPAAIHGNYEAIADRTHGLFHSDAARMFEFGRPVCALLTNLPLLVLGKISDLWLTRAFSLLTVGLLGALLIGISVRHLKARPLAAAVVAAGVFMAPGFSYSVYEPAAWAPHLVGILIAFLAFERLSCSNVRSLALLSALERREFADFLQQAVGYSGSRDVAAAGLIYLLAFYDYPPVALVLALFPVITMLLGRLPLHYRLWLAVRDLAFISVVTFLYLLTVKLIYLPIVGLFVTAQAYDPVFASKVGNTYAFALQGRVDVLAARIGELLRVAADLWFLPQLRSPWGLALFVGLLASIALATGGRPAARGLAGKVAIVGLCILVAGAPVLFAVGGFVSYRTTTIATAIVAVVVVAAACGLVTGLCKIRAVARIADAAHSAALLAILGLATAGTLQTNLETMTLARNEQAYFAAHVKQALDQGAASLVWLDSRPLFLSEDVPEAIDGDGRSIPPYELSCFASYCISSQSIIRAILRELHRSPEALAVWTPRGDPEATGVTCAMLRAQPARYPANASSRLRGKIDFYRRRGPIYCFDYDLSWRILRK